MDEKYDLFFNDYVLSCSDISLDVSNYIKEKNKLGIKLLSSETGYNHMLSTISCRFVMLIEKIDNLFKDNELTSLGDKFISMYLNIIYEIGLDNILDIDIKDLEILENFFDELKLNPYKREREYQKCLKNSK